MAMISPPLAVAASAAVNVRQGLGTVHGSASLPFTETAERLFKAKTEGFSKQRATQQTVRRAILNMSSSRATHFRHPVGWWEYTIRVTLAAGQSQLRPENSEWCNRFN